MLLGILLGNDEALINQVHDIFAGLTTIIMYGAMVLAGFIAALEFDIYNGPSGYNPFV